ncbi:MAG TPA: hypothetical protein VIM70_01620 [Clostridium sp.]|uniref:hypothetical protein n=1 Tax=Clostridium sp. TaxID=1506 RepID=UPI002F93B8CA
MLYGIKDCANLQIISTLTNKPVMYCNYAKTSSIDFTSDSVYAFNKTTKAIRWDKAREGTFKTEMEIFETKMIAMLFGTTITSTSMSIAKREVLAVQAGGGGASLLVAPKAGSLSVFKLNSDMVSQDIEQLAGTPATTPNTYSIATLALTLNATTFSTAGYIVAYYLVDSTVSKFTVDNASFPSGFKIYADSAIRGTDQVDKFVQYQLLNVKPKSNVSLTMDVDNVAKLSIEWDILADSAGNMMHYVEV